MKKKFISIAVSALVCATAVFNVMAATEDTTDTVEHVASATEVKENSDIKVTLNRDSVKKTTGKKFKVKAKVNQKGHEAKLFSTNEKVAVVNKNGVVKTKKAGTAKIVAKCNGAKDICKVEVVNKGNSITTGTMKAIAAKTGCQINRYYGSSSIMCSAYSFSYAYQQVTGKYLSPGSVWTYGGCNWNGGTYRRLSSASSMLQTIKNEIDNNKACVGFLGQSSGQHYVTFYSYTGNGTSLSDFTVIDPWDGEIKNAAEFYIYRYHVVTINN